jgi:hypothetical protein
MFKNFRPDATMTAGDLKIDPAKLKGVEYRFNINPNSTAKDNKEQQISDLERLMTNIGKFQNILKDDARVDVNFGAMMETYENISGIKGAQNFITVKDGPSPHEQQMMDTIKQMQEELQKAKDSAIHRPVTESLNYKDAPPDVKSQIETQAGLVASATHAAATASAIAAPEGTTPPPAPVVAASGHMFNNPDIAQVASTLHEAGKTMPPPAEPTPPPTVASTGHMFNNPDIAQVADALNSAGQSAPAKKTAKKK